MSVATVSRAVARPNRRGVLLASGGVLLAAVLVWVGAVAGPGHRTDRELYAETPPVDARETAVWLAAGTVPVVPELGDSMMIRDALRDLHTLSRPYGVPVAGWSPAWRYVWPRDSSLAAAALARTGHPADAEQVLSFLAQVQPTSGVFQARYLPDGSGVPDDRGAQLDGTGWALWATGQVAETLPAADRLPFVQRHRALLDRSTAAALATIDNPSSLPPASPDYWEVPGGRPTLATAAVLHAGLLSAAGLYGLLGEVAAEGSATAGAHALGVAIQQRFGQHGYPRHPGGPASSVDLGVDFVLPPFNDWTDPAAVRAWRRAGTAMARPAGGLAPGGSWRKDGVSWTTSTSVYALTAAAIGDRAEAVQRLRWLDQHRTAAGSLPEKVTASGDPAAVAPLAWAAAAVILTADRLGRSRS